MQVASGQGGEGGAGGAPAGSSPPSPPAAPPPPPAGSSPPTPPAGSSPPSPPAAPPPPPTPATRPDYIPETLWDAEKNAVKGEDLGKILKAHSDRQADLITDPTKVKLKTELKNTDGSPIEFKMDSPLMVAASKMAVERGWTNGDLSAMGELIVSAQLAAIEAENQEILALGNGDRAKADARMNTVLAKGAALLGADDQGNATPEAKTMMGHLLAAVHTRAEFEALEKLITAAGGPAAAAAGGAGGEVKDIAKRWYPNEATRKAG